MTVYVDDMQASYGQMIMCHMIADTRSELMSMVDNIGVSPHWLQRAGTSNEHFDICLSKRARAVKNGAIELTMREFIKVIKKKRAALWRESHGL